MCRTFLQQKVEDAKGTAYELMNKGDMMPEQFLEGVTDTLQGGARSELVQLLYKYKIHRGRDAIKQKF